MRAVPPMVAGILPAFLLAFGVGRFILNHFYVRAPYLLDSGMLSKILYRDGISLPLPKITADYAASFYDVHVSPLSSVISALSYLAPVGRIEWFAIIEGLLYVPIGISVYVVASRLEPASALRRLPLTMLAALAFAFGGLVLWMVDYPHFEVATPGLVCLVLAALVTDRPRLAWLCVVLAACVKQDGGIHVAVAVLPLLFLAWRGHPMAPTRRKLVAVIAVAIGITAAELVVQRVLFVPYPRLTHAYLGDPLYGHLSWQLVTERARHFIASNQVIYYPLLATCLIAALRRDGRYLLGWASVVPWFVFNLLAVEETKAWFVAYGIGPFLVGLFWVYLYGAHLAPAPRRLRAGVLEATFAVVCASSTLGAYRAQPVGLGVTVREMAISHHRDREAVDGFVDALNARPAELGHLGVDYAVAALAIESVEMSNRWYPGITVDALAFHRGSLERDGIMPDILLNRLDRCTRIVDTYLVVCSRDQLPAAMVARLTTEEFPSLVAFAQLGHAGTSVRVARDRFTVLDGGTLQGWLGRLPAGSYEWRLQIVASAGDMRVDVVRGDSILATAAASTGEVTVRLTTDGQVTPLGYRITSRGGDVAIIGSTLQRVGD